MHLDDATRDSLITTADDDVLDLELIRRRLIGRHHDIGLLTYRHDPNLPTCALSGGPPTGPARQPRYDSIGGYVSVIRKMSASDRVV